MAKAAKRRPRGKRQQAAKLKSVVTAVFTKLRIWQKHFLSLSFWFDLAFKGPPRAWKSTTFFLGWLYTIVVRIPWVIAVVVVGTIIIQGLTQETTVIKPIFVPKILAEHGYTPEVAGQRLRDAIVNFTATISTPKKSPEIALYGDMPNIVVPAVGISLDAILTSIRTLSRSTRSRTISGEIIFKQDRYWLVLRVDDKKIYESKEGVEPGKLDDLFAAAVLDVLKVVNPYLVALSLSYKEPDDVLYMVGELLSQLPAGNENVAWLYNLRGRIYLDRENYTAATAALKTALRLTDNRLVVAHVNLGTVYAKQKQYEQAAAEYNIAIALDPKYGAVHYNLAVLMLELGNTDRAIAELRKAIELDGKDIDARIGLAELLRSKNQPKEAKEQYLAILKFAPDNKDARDGLAELANQ